MNDHEERRKWDQDHDMLVEMHTILLSIKETHEKHVEDDDKHFGRIYKKLGSLTWYVAIGLGIVLTIEFLSPHIIK